MIRSQEQLFSKLKTTSSISFGSSKGPQRPEWKKIVFRITGLLFLGMSAQNHFLFFEELLSAFAVIEMLLLSTSLQVKTS